MSFVPLSLYFRLHSPCVSAGPPEISASSLLTFFFVNEPTLHTSVRITGSLSSSPAPLTAICQLFSKVQDVMRCLDTHTGEFVDINPECTNYAILSHTWDEGGEQTYTELREIQKRYDARGQHRQRAAISLQPLPSSLDASPSSSRRSSFK